MRANSNASKEDRLDDAALIAQVTYVEFNVTLSSMFRTIAPRTLVFAATDTSGDTISRVLHLLAQHPHVQDKLRQEIIESDNGEDISYDQLMEQPLLDGVVRETMRL